MIKGVTHAHLVPIWYQSEPSDIHYSPNQFLGWDFFLPILPARWLYPISQTKIFYNTKNKTKNNLKGVQKKNSC